MALSLAYNIITEWSKWMSRDAPQVSFSLFLIFLYLKLCILHIYETQKSALTLKNHWFPPPIKIKNQADVYYMSCQVQQKGQELHPLIFHFSIVLSNLSSLPQGTNVPVSQCLHSWEPYLCTTQIFFIMHDFLSWWLSERGRQAIPFSDWSLWQMEKGNKLLLLVVKASWSYLLIILWPHC